LNSFWEDYWEENEKIQSDSDLISHVMQQRAKEYSYKLLGNISGKKILDVGCGSGSQSVEFASRGAIVTAIDVVDSSVRTTQSRLEKFGNHHSTHIADVEEIDKLYRGYFDLVYINCMLTHVTGKDKAIESCKCALKEEGGKIVVKENLSSWIFRFPYRTFSKFKDANLRYIDRDFRRIDRENTRNFYLISSLFLGLYYLLPHKIANLIVEKIAYLDDRLFLKIPFISRASWVIVFEINTR